MVFLRSLCVSDASSAGHIIPTGLPDGKKTPSDRQKQPFAYRDVYKRQPNNYSLNNESKQLDTITATVFVEETLATDKNEDIYVSNSRLLSKDEVENIGIDNFLSLIHI